MNQILISEYQIMRTCSVGLTDVQQNNEKSNLENLEHIWGGNEKKKISEEVTSECSSAKSPEVHNWWAGK